MSRTPTGSEGDDARPGRGRSPPRATARLRHRPPVGRRARAVTSARLAELQLDRGHLGRACATWHELLDTVGPLESSRVAEAARGLRARLRAAGGNRTTRALLTRLAPRSVP
ncbi:hypothetical protein ABZW32_20575 [Streptomyces sp. NPDC004667]|uniref:hypothetical protein n=1 Tax=Streptomyces sp. NPDC004667 TaxID=3154285 RepID=UPI0033A3D5A0